MLKFRKKRRHETGNLKTDLFLGHLQPPLEKNSEDLAILILELDDVTVKTIYCFLSSLEEVQLGVQFGVHVLYRPCSRCIKMSLLFHARTVVELPPS